MEAKKTPSADLTKKVGMFTNLGLAVAVGLTLAAFEYKSFDDSGLKDLGSVADNFEELLDVPVFQELAELAFELAPVVRLDDCE